MDAPLTTPGTGRPPLPWGLRTDLRRHGDGGDSSRVGYVELFFDLVFVFAVTQLSHGLIAHPGAETLAHTLVLGVAVWWVWVFTMWTTNWLDPERVPVRTMLVVLMLLGLVLFGIGAVYGKTGAFEKLRHVTWIGPWLVGHVVLGWLGRYGKGSQNILPDWVDLGVALAFSLGIFYWAVSQAVPERDAAAAVAKDAQQLESAK